MERLEPIEYLYRPLMRPPSSSTVPEGWDYVEAPFEIAVLRGLPVSKYQFGIIAYSRRLTKFEMKQFGLQQV